MTISASSGLGPLQMVSEPSIGRCTSDDAGLPRGVKCEIPHRLERERNLLYKDVETSP